MLIGNLGWDSSSIIEVLSAWGVLGVLLLGGALFSLLVIVVSAIKKRAEDD